MQDIEKPSQAYSNAADKWELDADIWGGRETMRDAGDRRLPRLPAEDLQRWEIRKLGARYYPGYASAVRGLAGRLREVQAKPVSTVPEWLMNWFWDLSYENIMYDARIDGIRHGVTFLICDLDEQEGVVVRQVEAADMLSYWPENGPLQYVKFKRQITSPKDKPYNLIYEIEQQDEGVLEFAVYSNESGDYVEITREAAQVPFFPVVKLQYSEDGYCPYFYDLACLNEAHWQSSAMQTNALSFSRFNLIWGNGLPDDLEFSGIGPSALLALGEGGTLDKLEGGGAGIEAGRHDLETLEAQMAMLSARPLVADGVRSATEVNRSSQQEDAPIRRLADMEIAATRELLRIAAMWADYSGLSSIDIEDLAQYDVEGTNEFVQIETSAQDAQVIGQLFAAGILDRDTAIRGIIGSIPALRDVDPADVIERIEL